jgi:hypothetical protein
MNLGLKIRFPGTKSLYLYKKKDMDLQSRKMNLIGYLMDIQDEQVFSRIESQILSDREQNSRQNLKQFTQEELINRAEEATREYLAGKTKTQDQLESESKGW